MSSEDWASIYLIKYKHLCPIVRRLLALTCSASGCEHAWSIEGWIHSKKRNRLGQDNVNRLIRAHTNLHLRSLLKDWVPQVLPWDIEMLIEDPEPDPVGDLDGASDDDDGPDLVLDGGLDSDSDLDTTELSGPPIFRTPVRGSDLSDVFEEVN